MSLTKDEVIKLAKEHGNCGFDLFHFEEHELLAFANACEKIGMEKAAKICDSLAWSHKNAAMLGPENNCIQCANAIRKNKE